MEVYIMDKYVGKNTKSYWNQKHNNQYTKDGVWDYDQIPQSPLSYHKVASDILSLNKDSVKRKSVLEIGCAAGFFTSYLKIHLLPHFEITGWDFSPYGIEIAKNTIQDEHGEYLYDIQYEERDFLEKPIEENYGFICMFETLEHVAEPDNYKVVDNILNHCEYAIISTVNTVDDCGGEHISHYTIDSFDEHGYEVIWKQKLAPIDMSATGDFNEYYYFIVLLKGKLSN